MGTKTQAQNSWHGSVMYFVLIDRFQNGDTSNDDCGQGEYSPTDDDCFQGGDLKGLRLKLPYIKKMGFDSLWISPPVHNQWVNPYIKTRGYHGYWTYDFTQVDPHFGTLEDYRAIVRDAHALGLKVIQDIVVNHTGNYFTISNDGYDPSRPELSWKSVEGAIPPVSVPKAPRDPVFSMNNPNIPDHKHAGVYNFTPNISDFRNREQTLTYAMGDLDDINLNNPLAAERIKEIYRYWIEEVGIDGFRVDTVYYTPEHFYENFLYAEDPKSPGIKPCAQRKGIRDFFVFGEVWSYDYKAIGRYLKKGRIQRLDSAIDLPLNEALTQVFYRKAPTENARAALTATRHNPELWVNFLDNHDVERMHSRAGWPAIQQSLVALFTLPGIPCVYYGTETEFTLARQNMFDEKYFKKQSPTAQFIKELIEFRKKMPVLATGQLGLEATSYTPGILAYTLSNREHQVLVVFNTSPDPVVYQLNPTHLNLKSLRHSVAPERNGDTLLLPPESYFVFEVTNSPLKKKKSLRAPSMLKSLNGRTYRDQLPISFRPIPKKSPNSLYLICDGNLSQKIAIPEPTRGRFNVSAREFGNGRHKLSLLAQSKSGALQICGESEVVIRNPYRLITQAPVPEDNKGGPNGVIHPPAESSYAGQMSMRRVRALTSGRDLRLELEMANVTNDWNPPHGYDHVYFHIFFDFPNRDGKLFLPKLNAHESDFKFNSGFLLYGWGMRSFSSEDSTADQYGAPLFGEIHQFVNKPKKIITFTFSDRLFDKIRTFSGTKILITTWDGYLGDLRELVTEKSDWSFFTPNGIPKDLPRIYDRVQISL